MSLLLFCLVSYGHCCCYPAKIFRMISFHPGVVDVIVVVLSVSSVNMLVCSGEDKGAARGRANPQGDRGAEVWH